MSSDPNEASGPHPSSAKGPGEPRSKGSEAPDEATSAPAGPGRAPGRDPLRRSRASGLWLALVVLVVLLGLLAVFVLQNTQQVEISYFGWSGQAPLAAMLLIATAAGLLIAVAAGSARILQLRLRVRRERRR